MRTASLDSVDLVQSVYRTLVYLPTIVPSVVMALLWLWIFNPDYGLLNGILSFLHLPTGVRA